MQKHCAGHEQVPSRFESAASGSGLLNKYGTVIKANKSNNGLK